MRILVVLSVTEDHRKQQDIYVDGVSFYHVEDFKRGWFVVDGGTLDDSFSDCQNLPDLFKMMAEAAKKGEEIVVSSIGQNYSCKADSTYIVNEGESQLSGLTSDEIDIICDTFECDPFSLVQDGVMLLQDLIDSGYDVPSDDNMPEQQTDNSVVTQTNGSQYLGDVSQQIGSNDNAYSNNIDDSPSPVSIPDAPSYVDDKCGNCGAETFDSGSPSYDSGPSSDSSSSDSSSSDNSYSSSGSDYSSSSDSGSSGCDSSYSDSGSSF